MIERRQSLDCKTRLRELDAMLGSYFFLINIWNSSCQVILIVLLLKKSYVVNGVFTTNVFFKVGESYVLDVSIGMHLVGLICY